MGVDLGGVAGNRVRDIEMLKLGRWAGPVMGGLDVMFRSLGLT